jgi:type I restriction enzyme S subunit
MVEWKKLGEVCEIGTGSNNREDACDNGCYPFYVRSQEVLKIDLYSYDEEAILIPGEGGICDIFHYVNGKYGLHQRTYRVHPVTDDVKGRYIYYYLFANFKTYINAKSYKSTAASIRKPMLLDFPIPIPSLEEQNRIVGILDTFTSAIDNLKEQIARRRKQYEYYRDQLLDLEGKPGVEMKTLGDLGDVTKLAGFEFTEYVTYEENGSIIALRGLNVRNGHLDLSQVKYIDGSNFAKLERSKLLVDDMLFTYVGTIGNVALVDENERYYLAPNVSRIRFDMNVVIPKYALYIFLSDNFHRKQINKFLNSSSMKNLSMENIRKFCLPLPPLSEQQRIVSILDTFEASIQNLEAQLKERQKQYEYYRNKLLTFE